MPTEYKLNGKTIYICPMLPSEAGQIDSSKYVKVFEPSTSRHLTVRKSKLETVEATNPLERLLEAQQ